MSAQDRDRDDILPPDAPPGPGEQAEAESFARLVEQLLFDRDLPPVMPSEERALIETAAVVRACTGEPRLAEPRQRALVDQVLARVATHALGHDPGQGHAQGQAGQAQPSVTAASAPDVQADQDQGRTPGQDMGQGPGQDMQSPTGARAATRSTRAHGRPQQQQSRLRRALPWAVAVASAAAALALALRTTREPVAPLQQQARPRLQTMHLSRPADDLIGEIPRPRAAAASDRVDMIYADRLMGYRDLRLRGGRP